MNKKTITTTNFKEVIDWSKVEVNTPILVKQKEKFEVWKKGHFAYYEDGIVYAWADGGTSFTREGDKFPVSAWSIAKIYKGEE